MEDIFKLLCTENILFNSTRTKIQIVRKHNSLFNRIQAKKASPTAIFPHVTSTNVGISPPKLSDI